MPAMAFAETISHYGLPGETASQSARRDTVEIADALLLRNPREARRPIDNSFHEL